jgi:non-homologous end joining protein Ku
MLTLREKHEYEQEIDDLKAKLKAVKKAKRKIKAKYDKLKDKHVNDFPTRSEKAKELIKLKWSGELDMTLQQIADKVFLSHGTVRDLSSKYKSV